MIIKLVRKGIGGILAGISRITQPKPLDRSPEEQAQIDEAAKSLSVYQFYGCPFCIKVRREAHRLGIPLQYRDAQGDSSCREELLTEGGKIQVPCLRIQNDNGVEWLYESKDVIAYLKKRFG